MRHIAVANILADLQTVTPTDGDLLFLLGKNNVGDGLGGFYRYDANSTATVDNVFLNSVASTTTTAGRWVRVFQRAAQLPQGILVTNGGVKTLYVQATTDSTGSATIYMTVDGTPTGTPIFGSIMANISRVTTPAANPSQAVQTYIVSTSSDLRTTTHGCFRPNALTVAVGAVYNPYTTVGAGISVAFEIEGT